MRYRYKHIREPAEPFEVKEYLETKRKENEQITRTLNTLKGIHNVLKDLCIHTRNQEEQQQGNKSQAPEEAKIDNKGGYNRSGTLHVTRSGTSDSPGRGSETALLRQAIPAKGEKARGTRADPNNKRRV